ncbi:MAG: glycoside hydrolase family 9 protein [Bacteroidetes bacterium]|nr:glycoside hydrolase family 9 protein [Bacteroidota bacterium]MCW5896900.1 glycoside hydrolase family 9 protein [Bacteroidota bacterium]
MKNLAGTILLVLMCFVAERGFALDRIAVSQVGFAPTSIKQFSSPAQFTSFEIRRISDNALVFAGGAPLRQVTSALIGGLPVWIGDFTAFTDPGRYKVVAGGLESYPFNIDINVFDQPVRAAQRMFYYQRAFTEITMPYAEGPWVHPSDADKAPAGIVKGWHDAGDYAIYMPTMAQSIFWLLEAWSDFGPLDDNTNIPESGNGVPDLLDEVRWGLEWVRSMQDPNGGFWGSACPGCNNNYYCGTSFPHTIPQYCKSIPPTVQNTAKAIAVLAYGSRVYTPYDAAFANSCLSAAQAGWTWMINNPTATNDAGPCTYEQGADTFLLQTNRMWAAAAMLYATGNPMYETAFQSEYQETGWISSYSKTDGFANSLYLRTTSGANPATQNAIRQQIFVMADTIRSDANNHPFQYATHYYWGCNGNAMHRSGEFSWRAYFLDTTRVADRDQALSNLDYIFGRNYYNQCYVSGISGVSKPRVNGFHHWMKALNANPWHYPGALAGGPNEFPDVNDISYPGAQPYPVWGYWGDPANPRSASTPVEGRFTENDSWSTNEIDINWNSVLVYNLYAAKKIARGGNVNGIVRNSAALPEGFALYQNYPNPFNPLTTIEFNLPHREYVTVAVYNMLGQDVALLLNETQDAGKYTLRFDASGLTSGVYFYRLQAGGYSQTRSMVLVK